MAVKKDEKHGTWYYYGRYTDALGNKKQYKKRGFKTKKEAKEAEQRFLLDPNSQSSMTLDDIVDLYMNREQVHGLKKSTLYTNKETYDNHIKPAFGNKKVSAITVNAVELFVIHLRTAKNTNGKTLNYQTINHIKGTLSKFLNYALRLGLIKVNPCTLVPNVKPNQDETTRRDNFWELSEFDKFIKSVDSVKWQDIFYFLFETGVRKGELIALQWQDISFADCKVSINKTVTYRTNKKGPSLTPPKTKRSIRTIDLPDSLTNRLRQRYERESKKDGFNDQYFVFGDIRPMATGTLNYNLKKYIAKSGVKPITVHGFRHSHASLLIERGISDVLIAERLGHSVSELHKTYAHIYESRRDDMCKKLNNIF